MTTKQIIQRIEEISSSHHDDWDQDAIESYTEMLTSVQEARDINNFNLCINIGDNPENIMSNITIILFEQMGPGKVPMRENKTILDTLGEEDIISKKFINEDTLIINFDF